MFALPGVFAGQQCCAARTPAKYNTVSELRSDAGQASTIVSSTIDDARSKKPMSRTENSVGD